MSFGGGSSPPPPPPPAPTTVPLRQLTEVPPPKNDGSVRSFMDAGAAASFAGYGQSSGLLSSDQNKRGASVLGGQ